MEEIGNAYIYASNELESLINEAVKKQGIVEIVKTPENLAQLDAIIQKYNLSPKLREDYLKANSFTDFRALQSKFVKLDQMVAIAENNLNAPFPRSTMYSAGRIGAAVAGSALGGPLGTALGIIGYPLIEPFITAGIQRAQVPLSMKLAQGVATAAKTWPSKIISGTKAVGEKAKQAGQAITSPYVYPLARQEQRLKEEKI